jgi:hypothetical protein
MTAAAQPGSDDELGPVDFLAIEFPGGRLTAPGFEQLLSAASALPGPATASALPGSAAGLRRAASPQPAGANDRLAQLKQLGELLSAGVLTQAEFEQEKARILNS